VITIPQRHGQTDGQTTCRSNRRNRCRQIIICKHKRVMF